jgi:hypothetical protein
MPADEAWAVLRERFEGDVRVREFNAKERAL